MAEKVGKYELIRKLATGGTAEVFLARTEWARGVERTVVVKRILPHLAEDQSFVSMFLGEAKLAAHLSHPNIAQIFEFGESGGSPFLAMEYVNGPTLRTLAMRAHELRRPIPFRTCSKLMSYACEALAYAHELEDPTTGKPLQLVHRDVSPDNIIVARNGAVKVVDFGIAKARIEREHTKTGFIKGKLEYMPPEQLRAQPLDRRADVFALGVVLYELIAGKQPYDANSDVTLMHALLFDPIIPIRERRPEVPPELEAIVNRSFVRERDERYPDCRAMYRDLERYIIKSGEDPVGAFEIGKLVAELVGTSPGQPGEAQPDLARTEAQPTPVFGTGSSERGETVIVSQPTPPSKRRPEGSRPRSLPPEPPTVQSNRPGVASETVVVTGLPVEHSGPPSRPLRRPSVSRPTQPEGSPRPPSRKPLFIGGALGLVLLNGIAWFALSGGSTASVLVDVAPKGATVLVDGRELVNGTVAKMPVGEHELMATAPGYKPLQRRFTVGKGSSTVYFELLQESAEPAVQAPPAQQSPPLPSTFTAVFETEETGVEIVLEGKPVGKAPGLRLLDLVVGRDYAFTARKLGYKAWSGTFRSDGEREVSIPLKMERLSPEVIAKARAGMGQLACATRPHGAMVFIDGAPTGRTTPVPVSNPILAQVGTHQVTFKLNGKQVERTVELKPGELSKVTDVDLE